MRACCLFLLCLACGGADAQTTSPWFDADDLLANLRTEDQRAARSAIAPLRLDQLPFYDLDITLADDQASFAMREDIYYTNNTGGPLASVVLRLWANAVGPQAQVRLAGSECVNAECSVVWDRRSVFEVRPQTPIPPGGRLHVRLELRGALTEIDTARTGMMAQAMESLARQSDGGEHGDYGLLSHGGGVASMGNFYAMIAPYRNGDWVRANEGTMGDLGADAVCHFRAHLRAKMGAKVAITGHILSQRTHLRQGEDAGYEDVIAVAGMARNFAIVVGDDMQSAVQNVGPIEVRSWFAPADRARGLAALDSAAHAIRIFEQGFGRYPFTDFELVEAPLVGGAGGVEFTGLVTVATMFYQSGMGGMGGLGGGSGGGGLGGLLGGSGGMGGMFANIQASMLEFVVAHEVAHQWWHGLVGSDARAHPFVDESLAQFSAIYYMEERYGAERAEQEGNRQVRSNYHMMRLQGGSDAIVDQSAEAFVDETAYAGIVYGKGPYLYPALRTLLGPRRFFRQMRAYVEQHRFRVAAPRALFDQMATGSHRDGVRALERRWLDETHGDEDLGEGNMDQLMQTWTGQSGIGDMMRMLQGAGIDLGGAVPGTSPNPNGNGNADADGDEAIQQLLRQLQGM